MRVKEIDDCSLLKKAELCITINGNNTKTEVEFLTQIYDKLFFSDPEYMNWDAYVDWMRDLSWISEKDIVILVYNWESFLSKAKDINKNLFVSDYEDVIFPYWEEEKQTGAEDKYLKTVRVVYTQDNEHEVLRNINLFETNAAVYYAKGYINRVFKMDVIAGFETSDKWVFTGGFKDTVMYGNPRVALTKNSGKMEPLNIKISELLKLSQGANPILL